MNETQFIAISAKMKANPLKFNENQIYSQFEMKIKLKPKSWQNSKKIDQKWDKNKNNGFGLEQPNLIIKSQHFEWKSMKNQWKINENWMKSLPKIQRNS